MPPVYVGEPLARALYELVMFLWLGSELYHGMSVFVRIARAGKGMGQVRQDRLSGPALIAGIGFAVVLGVRAAVFVPRAAITFARPEIFALGLIVALAGIAFRWYAIVRLGRFFTTRVMVAPDQTVVDTGPYRLVRHPSYTGALLTLFGVLSEQHELAHAGVLSPGDSGLRVQDRGRGDGAGRRPRPAVPRLHASHEAADPLRPLD